jgi:hypothetical protein
MQITDEEKIDKERPGIPRFQHVRLFDSTSTAANCHTNGCILVICEKVSQKIEKNGHDKKDLVSELLKDDDLSEDT